MNRLVNSSLACLMAATCLFSSCNRDDWMGKTENPHPELIRYNDSDLLLHSFLEQDEDGNVTECYFGSYDPASPGVVNITVRKSNPIEWARELMKSIIPDGADITETEDELVWNLKDAEGKPEGQMVFKRSTAPGQFAVVEIPKSARPLSQIVFKKPLLTDSWQERYNSCDELDPYYLGATIHVRKGELPEGSTEDGLDHGTGDFLVIREYEAGAHSGLLVRLVDEEHNINWQSSDEKRMHNVRSTYYCVLYYIHKILEDNPSYRETMSYLGMADWDNGFFYNTQRNNVDARINMKTGESCELGLFGGWYYREAWVYRFEPREMKDGSLKIWIVSDRLYSEKY